MNRERASRSRNTAGGVAGGSSGRRVGSRGARRGKQPQSPQQQMTPRRDGGGGSGGGHRKKRSFSFGGSHHGRRNSLFGNGSRKQQQQQGSRSDDEEARALVRSRHAHGLSPTNDLAGPLSGRKVDAITVAVRFRPMSKKEKARGDIAVWEEDGNGTVAFRARGGIKAKYKYDRVFAGETGNQEVYQTVAEDVVKTAMSGINGTVFAYGVTSSGKTHTIMGNPNEPGIVPQAIGQVFDMIEDMPSKVFHLRLSMMEIYNEILNDLLDPSRTNLKIRQHGNKGIHVEGLKEEVVVNQEHALSLIAAGEANRKVSATAFNEDSSRSHTVCRLSIEISDRVEGEDMSEHQNVARTLSYLNLIDLAGSESAKATERSIDYNSGFSFRRLFNSGKATKSKGHRIEGSYINKSLLTLGTVIHKLSEGRPSHVPFRDSKLTRLLQPSLTGNGAKVAIICTVTPSSAQSDETHNTLKFATRAKKIEVRTSKNEIMDEKSLIRRYQVEIADLKKQLEDISAQRAATPVTPDGQLNKDVEQELCDLKERLEEELRARLQREEDKSQLEARIQRLTRLILHSTQTMDTSRVPKALLRSRSFEHPRMESVLNLSRLDDPPDEQEDGISRRSPLSTGYSSWCSTPVDFTPPGSELSFRMSSCEDSRYIVMETGTLHKMEKANSELRERVDALVQVMDEREKDVNDLKCKLRASQQSPTPYALNTSSTTTTSGDLQMSVLQADREVLVDALSGVRAENRRLLDDNVQLKVQLKKYQKELRYTKQLYAEGLNAKGSQVPSGSDPQERGGSIFVPPGGDQDSTPTSPTGSNYAAEGAYDTTSTSTTTLDRSLVSEAYGLMGRWSGNFENMSEADIRAHLTQMEHQAQAALDEVVKKDQELSQQKHELAEIQKREQKLEAKVIDLVEECDLIKNDHGRLQEQNQRLQGYLLDGMSGDDLNKLIYNLTSAAKRVKLAVQMRKIQTATSPGSNHDSNKQSSEQA